MVDYKLILQCLKFPFSQEMNGYNLFAEECNLNLHDTDVEEFLSHDIANAFQEQNKQQCFTSRSIPTTLINTSSSEINLDSFDFDFDKPIMELKTIDHSNKINETFSPKLSPSPSNSSFQFQIPCFDNTLNSSTTNSSQFSGIEKYEPVSQTSKESSRKRSRAHHGQDHIMAERKRREKLTQNFIALAALVPNLKKVQ